MALEQRRQSCRTRLIPRQIEHMMLGQKPVKQRVHSGLRIAYCHRASGVAVIAARKGDEFRAAADAAVEPILHRHLHGDFDRDRAGVGKKHPVEIARHQRSEPPRQGERLLVDQPAEHDMGHHRELALDRGADIGMAIAVTGGPPGGNAVDQLAPVCEHDAASLRAGNRQRRARGLHLRIGQPDVGEPGFVPGRRGGGLVRWCKLPFHGRVL